MTTCQYTLRNQNFTDTSSNDKSKYTFLVEWYDPVAQIIRKFLMTFYSVDQTVELYDLKNHRTFLRRYKQEGIKLDNLYKSATVTIMCRQIKIIDYADLNTRSKFEVELSHTLTIVKPDIIDKLGDIIIYMQELGFKIIKMKMGCMTPDCVTKFYNVYLGKSFFPALVSFMSSGPSVAMVILGEDAINKWRELMGPMDSEEAKKKAPHTIRAKYGTDITRNAVHGSYNAESVPCETDFWFSVNKTALSENIKPTCIAENTTCCIIKPHAVLENLLGPIIHFISENGYKITALEMFTLDTSTAEEFLEVYKGVAPEYSAMVSELTSGPCVALEVLDTKNPECTQETFRKLSGPTDPEIAKKLRPDTIRAKFGKTKVLNAVHCTDLPDDAILEVEYFFKVLQI